MATSAEILGRIKQFARNNRYSIRSLSLALGKSAAYLGMYFTREEVPPDHILKKLGELGADVEWILSGESAGDARAQPVTESTHHSRGSSMEDPFISDLWNHVASALPGAMLWEQLSETQKRLVIGKLFIELAHMHTTGPLAAVPNERTDYPPK